MLKGGGVTRVWKCQRRAEGRRVTCDENDEVFTAKLPVGDHYSSGEYIGGVGKRLEVDLRAENLSKKNYAQL